MEKGESSESVIRLVSNSVGAATGEVVGVGVGEDETVGVGVGVGDGATLAEGVGLGVTMASGVGSGVADGVASGTSSGVIVSAEFVLVKIVSGFRRGSSGLGAGVSAECVASSGGDSWACAPGGAGRSEIHG
jgi:hypothetical protein